MNTLPTRPTCPEHSWCDPISAHDSDPPTEHHSPPRVWALPHTDPDPVYGLADTLTAQTVQVVGLPVRVRVALDNTRDSLLADLDASQARELAELLSGAADTIDLCTGPPNTDPANPRGAGSHVPVAGAELLGATIKLVGLLDVWERRPPAGEPAPVARRAGADAVLVLDELLRALHRVRASLVGEIRAHDDALTAATDELLAARRAHGLTAGAESHTGGPGGPSEGEDTRPVRDRTTPGGA